MLACLPGLTELTIAQQSVANADFVIARPVVNMYKGASIDDEVTSQALYGTGVVSLEKQRGWIRIRTADGYTGWVATSDVLSQKQADYAPDSTSIRVTGLTVNIYRDPDVTLHAPLLQLPWESLLKTVPASTERENARWIRVRLVSGESGWVQRGDVGPPNTNSLTIEETLQLARRFLGITYTWGGASSLGFDCSGFTQMLVRQRGVEMPRDANLQAAWSGVTPVSRDDLQPGDLLFFGSSVTSITHTGMYLGQGEFIHDTTHDHPGVQISRLNDSPWTKLLVAARRVKR